MENRTIDTAVTVPLCSFVEGQVALEKIKAVSNYISNTKYADKEVICGIIGIMVPEESNE